MMRTEGADWVDEHGRTLLLRGVNLGGSSKLPALPELPSWRREHFFEHRTVSFVGRPFPLEEADEHFARLRHWGLTVLRFLVPWEAVEHAGPGLYDTAYLDYLEAILTKSKDHGLSVILDPHQDVWSRFCGGSGAPGWTLELAGFQLEHLHPSGAAFIHCMHGDPLPPMSWVTNAQKLAASTMFTLFFAGETFAPRRKVEGVSIQTFLQNAYLNMLETVVKRVAHLPNVIGLDTLNEPLNGYIGLKVFDRPTGAVKLGPTPSALQSFALGMGMAQEVEQWSRGPLGFRRSGSALLNPWGQRAWQADHSCPWLEEGVYTLEKQGAVLQKPDYFLRVEGKEVSFEHFYRPFARRVARRVQSIRADLRVLLEVEPRHPAPTWSAEDAPHAVYAPHWYDGYVLMFKDFQPFIGVDFHKAAPILLPWTIRKRYQEQLEHFRAEALTRMGRIPVLLGETGVTFDMRGKESFITGDFSRQTAALDRIMVALEDARMSATLWNYTADNSHARGDQWNDEDLSLFCREDGGHREGLDRGGRALEALVRPYPMATAGRLISFSFDRKTRRFELVLQGASDMKEPTEVFLPRLQYPHGVVGTVEGGRFTVDLEGQRLWLWPTREDTRTGTRSLKLVLTPAPARV
ncbi:MAG: cellulase family glycosylhydrolase [Myxococcota bacterium]